MEGGHLPPSARVPPRAGEADDLQPPFRAAPPSIATHLARELARDFEAGPVQRTGPRSGSESSLPRRSFCPAARRILRPPRTRVKTLLLSACRCTRCEPPPKHENALAYTQAASENARVARREVERRAESRPSGHVGARSRPRNAAIGRSQTELSVSSMERSAWGPWAGAAPAPAPRTRHRRSTPCRVRGPVPAGSPTRSRRHRGC